MRKLRMTPQLPVWKTSRSVTVDDDAAASVGDAELVDGGDAPAPDSLAAGLRNIARRHPPVTASNTDAPTASLRRQAKRCRKRILAEQKGRGVGSTAGYGEEDDGTLLGIGSWPDSAVVPGGRGAVRVEESDKIELPRRKPHKVDWGQSLAREERTRIRREGRSGLGRVEAVGESQE